MHHGYTCATIFLHTCTFIEISTIKVLFFKELLENLDKYRHLLWIP